MPRSKKMKIGFTGTREGMTDIQWKTFIELLEKHSGEFHHGDCIGADAQAAVSAKELGFKIIIHPPISDSHRAFTKYDEIHPPKPYLKRDRDIVDASEQMYGCPKGMEEELRSGTWTTIRYAKKQKKPVTIIYPDGSTDSF